MKIVLRKLHLTEEQLNQKLRTLYFDEEMSKLRISTEIGITPVSLRRLFKDFNIQTREYIRVPQVNHIGRHKFFELHGFKSEEDFKLELIRLYNIERLSQPRIAKLFKCYIGQIYRFFRKYNIKTRSIAENNDMLIRPDVSLTSEQQQIINGILLGDGHLTKEKHTSSLTCDCHFRTILVDLQSKFPFEYCPIYERTVIKKNGTPTLNYKSRTHGYRQLLQLRQKWYPKGVKIVPKDIILTPTTCYWWYLGDGHSGKNRLTLFTNGFIFKDVKFLIGLLPIPGKLRRLKSTSGRILPVIDITTDYIEPFLRYIGPCQHKDLEHRWVKKTEHFVNLRESRERYIKKELIY